MIKHQKHILLLIVFLAILLKLPYISNPISDWHSWNQISTMANARYIAKEGVSAFLHPQVDLFESFETESNQSFAELPIISGLIAIGFKITNAEPEWLARLICILFSVLGSIYFYLLVLEETNESTAKIAIGFYLISPMVWYFHRTIMTDVIMVNFVIAGLYHFRFWAQNQKISSLIFAIFYTALAALSKAYALYIGIAYLMLLIEYQGWKKLIRLSNIIFLLGCVGPIATWILFCKAQITDGSAGRNLTAASELLGPISIWFDKTYWLSLLSSVGDFTLLPIGFLIFIYTFIRHFEALQKTRITLYWLSSVLFYFLFVRTGNMEHDYYQMPFAAPVIFITAIGFKKWFDWLRLKVSKTQYKFCIGIICVLLIIIAGKYTYTKAKLDMSPVLLGEKIKDFNPNKHFVLVIDPDYLQRNQAVYYSGSKGWHQRRILNLKQINEYKKHGTKYLGINFKTSKIQSIKPQLIQYDANFEKLWEGKSTDRYHRQKTLLIYKL
jgi:hypothetical protein